MTKKIFGMAAISALAFGLFACSGEDGADGINGKDGADGANCAVKALKDSSGFKVLCDGDSVGVLLNGTDGKAGADGKAGKDGKDGADGEDGADGSNGSAGAGKDGAAGKNGADCTAKAVKDGFVFICGEDTVGTIKNGTSGAEGDDCSLSEGDNGVVSIQCGKKTVELSKSLCSDGKTPFDPKTQLCGSYWDDELEKSVYVPIQRCKDWSLSYSYYSETDDRSANYYDPRTEFCHNGQLIQKCVLKDKDKKDSLVAYDYTNKWCDTENNKLSDKVACGTDDDGKKFKRAPSEYCYRKAGDPMTKMRTADSATCGSGNGLKRFSKVTHFCVKDDGTLGDKAICADKPAQADQYNIDIRYMTSEYYETKEGEMCDTRDGQIYKTKTIGEKTWMKQYLRYVPKNDTTADLDSSSFCYGNEDGDCSLGRHYLWSAIVDSTSLARVTTGKKFCGYQPTGTYEVCDFDAPFRGICPTGWHLPDAGESENSYETSLSLPRLGIFDAVSATWTGHNVYIELWTANDVNGNGAVYFAYYPNKTGSAQFAVDAWGYKYKARPVLCIKNPPAETP